MRYTALLFFLVGCYSLAAGREEPSPLPADTSVSIKYHAYVEGYKGRPIPFTVEVLESAKTERIVIRNAAERLVTDPFRKVGDSVFVTLPFFDAEFHLKQGDNGMDGYWVRHLPAGDRRYRLHLIQGYSPRFPSGEPAKVNVSGLWDMNFNGHHHSNVGYFTQDRTGRVTGSILSVSGDDRFLEGRVVGDSLFLSTFDGSHCYLYATRVNSRTQSLDSGHYYASANKPSNFTGTFNPGAKLEDVYTLTKMKPGVDSLSFRFKNLKGEEISYPNAQTYNKVTVIQFLGSWCPNCMDETAFLLDYQKKNPGKISVIGLAYERSNDWVLSRNSVQKLVDRFGIPYPVLVTGYKNSNEEVLASMPQLANYEAFPTMILIDKKGKVQKIHTGFSGPGTGKFYTEFEKEFSDMVNALQ